MTVSQSTGAAVCTKNSSDGAVVRRFELNGGNAMKRIMMIPTVLLAYLAATASAFAHVGVERTHGFAHGFLHPIGGFDHVLAMVAVGLCAAQLGGRALWLIPMTFVAIMALGGFVGMSGIEIPFIETGIAASVVVLGLMVAFQASLPIGVAVGLVGFFALFHGYAHGLEMPVDASMLGYALGFMSATATLHILGIGIGNATWKAGKFIVPNAAVQS
jgi:urease accessory protein